MVKQTAAAATRATRIAAIGAAHRARALAARSSAYHAAQNASVYATKLLHLQQLAAEYGIALPQQSTAARANSATVNPSKPLITVQGVQYKTCKAVQALCGMYPHYTRKQMVMLCVDNGVNKDTASTQVNLYRTTAAAAAAAAALAA
jgi:hypothetical protein